MECPHASGPGLPVSYEAAIRNIPSSAVRSENGPWRAAIYRTAIDAVVQRKREIRRCIRVLGMQS